jgi:hypothetical protein
MFSSYSQIRAWKNTARQRRLSTLRSATRGETSTCSPLLSTQTSPLRAPRCDPPSTCFDFDFDTLIPTNTLQQDTPGLSNIDDEQDFFGVIPELSSPALLLFSRKLWTALPPVFAIVLSYLNDVEQTAIAADWNKAKLEEGSDADTGIDINSHLGKRLAWYKHIAAIKFVYAQRPAFVAGMFFLKERFNYTNTSQYTAAQAYDHYAPTEEMHALVDRGFAPGVRMDPQLRHDFCPADVAISYDIYIHKDNCDSRNAAWAWIYELLYNKEEKMRAYAANFDRASLINIHSQAFRDDGLFKLWGIVAPSAFCDAFSHNALPPCAAYRDNRHLPGWCDEEACKAARIKSNIIMRDLATGHFTGAVHFVERVPMVIQRGQLLDAIRNF